MDKEIIMAPSSDGGLLGGGGIGALLIGALLFGGGLGGLGMGRNGYGTPAASAVATDVVLNPAFQSLGQQMNTLSSQIASNASNGYLAQNAIATNAAIDSNSRQILAEIANTQTAQAAGNFTTLSSINGLSRDIIAAQNQNALQQLNSFNNLTTTTLQGFNGLAMQNQNATNQIIVQGTANAATVAACCCEIKGLIQSDGNLTRALITDLNVQNLRDQLAAANGKVSNNEQNQYLLTTILSHLSPTRVVV